MESVLDGLDTVNTVMLNSEKIMHCDDMFAP